MPLNRREFNAALATSLPSVSSAVRCTVKDHLGQPLAADQARRVHFCDLLLRPIPVAPQGAAGEIAFQPPARPFRIALPLPVPGFGDIVVYADNRGRGYTAGDFARPLDLNREFAADRLATVEALSEELRRSGATVPAKTAERAARAAAMLRDGRFFECLSEGLWAGEELVLERARHAIAKRGPRPGFLFGANTFGFPKHGRLFAERYEQIFNYGTLPFYYTSVERTHREPNYRNIESILGWLGGTRILAKGHPLVWFFPSTMPAWLKGKSFDEARALTLDYAHRTVARFRDRIHVWDVINEAHLQNPLGFTNDQQIGITAAACRAAREADPTCFRVVNNCCTWCEYMSRRQNPGQQSVYDYLAAVRDAGVEFEAVGLQYYYAARDLLETERSIETYKSFGKPVHITELGLPSSSDPVANPFAQNAGHVWHGEKWTETLQAHWIEGFYTIAYSKAYIEAVSWWDVVDPAFVPHGGLLNADLTPKESFQRLASLVRGWRQ